MVDLYFGHTQLMRLSATAFVAVPVTEWMSLAFYGELGQIIATPGLPYKMMLMYFITLTHLKMYAVGILQNTQYLRKTEDFPLMI